MKIKAFGQEKTAAEWSRDLGLGKKAVLRRIRSGMNVEEALTTPKMKPRSPLKKVYQYKGDDLVAVWPRAKDAAEAIGGNASTIKWACNSGGKNAYGFTWRYKEDV